MTQIVFVCTHSYVARDPPFPAAFLMTRPRAVTQEGAKEAQK